jgi:signal transduction histidine kinase
MIVHSLKFRLLGLALVWSAVALIVAGLVISSLLRQFVERNFDAGLSATMVSIMVGTEFDQTGNLVLANPVIDPRFEQPLSGWYWQVSTASEIVARSRSLWDVDLGTGAGEPDGSVVTATTTDSSGRAIRLMRRDFTVPGGTERMRVLVSMPAEIIDAEVASIVNPLALSLALLGLGIAIAIGLQVHFGLQPLARMGRNIVAVRRGEMALLPQERYREIAPVVTELNGLIEHNRDVIARARTHVGNLAHGLKTPLSVLDNEIAGRKPADEAILSEVSQTMNRMIGHHLRRARSAATLGVIGTRTDVAETVNDLLPVFRGVYADRRLTISADVPAGLYFAGERQDLEEMLGNLIDNACKWTTQRVDITAAADNGHLSLRIADDGPGMGSEEAEAAKARGVRFDEAKPGSGLGLSIVEDLVQLYDGKLSFAANEPRGLVAALTLPAAR